MIRRLLSNSPIYIHSWGGLGSQLFALAFILHLRQTKYKKRIKLVHHTGGVTYRRLEESMFHHFEVPYKIVDDYRAESRVPRELSRPKFIKIRKILTTLITNTGIVITARQSGLPIHPWTIVIRHHYFREKLTSETLMIMLEYFQNYRCATPELIPNNKRTMLVHHRLGDLLTLPEKNPVSTERIAQVISFIIRDNDLELVLSSDSPDTAFASLSRALSSRNSDIARIKTFEGSLEEFLSAGMLASIFIGTNSKISIWVALFRTQLGIMNTYLPKELGDDFALVSPSRSIVTLY